MIRTLLAIIIVPGGAVLLFLALSPHERRADFVVASEELRTIDPQRASFLEEIEVCNALVEPLTRTDPATQAAVPGAAASWTVGAGGAEYLFSLRPDARWSDGRPVVADDFRRAWLRALDPRTRSQYASLLFVIRGAAEFQRSGGGESVGIAAVDDRTLRVTLTGPCPYFLDLTSFVTLAPLHPSAPGADTGGGDARWTRPGRLVSNGPYVLAAWDFKRRILLTRNPHYHTPAAMESIEIAMTGDPNSGLIAYETGRVDLVRTLDTAAIRALASEKAAGRRSDFHVGERFATYFFRVNCSRPPLDQAAFRRALALAIDKEALCGSVLSLGERLADTLVPRTCLELMPRAGPGGATILYEPPAGLGAGLSAAERGAAARRELAAAGITAGGVRPIEIAYPSDQPLQRRIAEAVQQMWRERLGLRVELRVMERNVLSARIRALDYDVVRSDWYGDYLDPATFLEMFTTGNGQNRTGWGSAAYDALIAAAGREDDDARRYELFGRAERLLCGEEVPIIPVYFKRGQFLLRPGIEELHDSVRDALPLHLAQRGSRVAAGAR
ncbi:MAG: Dipeptide-binding protein DppE [Phycisphaerae bacterium]|nr:Dipeptide-binding protein DppE [Phycisphaerae bacterium]